MSSQHYTFLFPAPGQTLSPADAVAFLKTRALEFDESVRICKAIDSDGHMLDVGTEEKLTRPFASDVKRRLRDGQNFSVQCRNSEIVVGCFFCASSRKPHLFFSWSRRLLADLAPSIREEYWSMICSAAKASKAGYVVVVDDAADNFEDRFIEIDGAPFLDTNVSHSYGHGIQQVWVDPALGAKPPHSDLQAVFLDNRCGFDRYQVV